MRWQLLSFYLFLFCIPVAAQKQAAGSFHPKTNDDGSNDQKQFIATANLIDAAINSVNSLNSLIKKESYRNKIAAFNNPAGSDLGFSLQAEINIALKPMLDKAKNTNTGKFSEVINSLINNPSKNQLAGYLFQSTGLFSTIISLVGNLAVHEKKVTKQDVDSFFISINRYFTQYEKLNSANKNFDQDINRLELKLKELQFDTREYMIDIITVLYKESSRQELKEMSLEELLLKYIDKDFLENKVLRSITVKYPGDGIKTAKEIVYGIQKLFNEYQQVYIANFNEIKAILEQSKYLGKNIEIKRLDASVKSLQDLYEESKSADLLNLRISTLHERLKVLVAIEQLK